MVFAARCALDCMLIVWVMLLRRCLTLHVRSVIKREQTDFLNAVFHYSYSAVTTNHGQR